MSEWKRKEGEPEPAHRQRMLDMKIMADVMRRDRIKPEDPDFKEKLSQYMAGEIDPSVARHIEFDLPEEVDLNLYGHYIFPKERGGETYNYSGTIDETDVSYTLAPDELAAFHTRNTPATWAHEFRHRNFPEMSENEQRIMDLLVAQTDFDLDEALRLQSNKKNYVRRKLERDPRPPSAEIENLDLLKYRSFASPNLKNALESFGTTDKKAYESSKAKELYDDAVALDKWNRGLAERNEKRKKVEPETWADALREVWEKRQQAALNGRL